MIDLIAATMDAVTKRLNGPNGLATVFLLFSVVMSAVTALLRSDGAKTSLGFVCFMVPVGTLTHDSARANSVRWILRKLLMLPMAAPTGVSIAIACGHSSHAAWATVFGDLRHASGDQIVAFSILLMIMTTLACDISCCLCQSLQHRIAVL